MKIKLALLIAIPLSIVLTAIVPMSVATAENSAASGRRLPASTQVAQAGAAGQPRPAAARPSRPVGGQAVSPAPVGGAQPEPVSAPAVIVPSPVAPNGWSSGNPASAPVGSQGPVPVANSPPIVVIPSPDDISAQPSQPDDRDPECLRKAARLEQLTQDISECTWTNGSQSIDPPNAITGLCVASGTLARQKICLGQARCESAGATINYPNVACQSEDGDCGDVRICLRKFVRLMNRSCENRSAMDAEQLIQMERRRRSQ